MIEDDSPLFLCQSKYLYDIIQTLFIGNGDLFMAKIYDFELKGIKSIGENGITGNLYYKNKKIALYTDVNDETKPVVIFSDKINDNLIDEIYNKVQKYYIEYPKETFSNLKEDLLIEFIEELYRLKELEDIFKKLNKKHPTTLIELRFSSRKTYITDYKQDDICISTTLWDEKFKEELLKKYNPAEYTLFTSLDDFII